MANVPIEDQELAVDLTLNETAFIRSLVAGYGDETDKFARQLEDKLDELLGV